MAGLIKKRRKTVLNVKISRMTPKKTEIKCINVKTMEGVENERKHFQSKRRQERKFFLMGQKESTTKYNRNEIYLK